MPLSLLLVASCVPWFVDGVFPVSPCGLPFVHVSLYGQISPFSEGTRHNGLGSTLKPHLTLIISKDPISK